MFALRFEGDSLPLAMVYDTVAEAVRQGAHSEFMDEARRVKDIVEVKPGDDPLADGHKKVAGRTEVNAERKLVDKDWQRTQDPDDGFHMLLSENSWMNTGREAPDKPRVPK